MPPWVAAFVGYSAIGPEWLAGSQALTLCLVLESVVLLSVVFRGLEVEWLRPLLWRFDRWSREDVGRALRNRGAVLLVGIMAAPLVSLQWSASLWEVFAVVVAVVVVAMGVGLLLRAVIRAVSRRPAGNDTAVDDESANETLSEPPRSRLWVEAVTMMLMTLGAIALTREADFPVMAAVATMWLTTSLICGLLPWDQASRDREPKQINWFGSHR